MSYNKYNIIIKITKHTTKSVDFDGKQNYFGGDTCTLFYNDNIKKLITQLTNI